jgi:MinD-like ATPase involved in chromosome partitioning or flagellar assembly
MNSNTLFTTFYSFKGGVGQTLTLVNTAAELARRGYSVIIWDMDFEAPAVQCIPYFTELAGKIKGGFVDIATEFVKNDYKDINHEKLAEFIVSHPDNFRLKLFPAGNLDNEKGYSQMFSSILWDELFKVGSGWNFAFQLFDLVRRDLANLGADFVLIDSRAGLSDISGVCCFRLPDVVCLVFNFSSQQTKTIQRIHHILTDPQRLEKIRPKQPLNTYLIASMIPMDRPDLHKKRKRQWLKNYPKNFKIHVEIPFNMEMVYNETIWPVQYPDFQFRQYYSQLADILLEEKKR